MLWSDKGRPMGKEKNNICAKKVVGKQNIIWIDL